MKYLFEKCHNAKCKKKNVVNSISPNFFLFIIIVLSIKYTNKNKKKKISSSIYLQTHTGTIIPQLKISQ